MPECACPKLREKRRCCSVAIFAASSVDESSEMINYQESPDFASLDLSHDAPGLFSLPADGSAPSR